MTQHDYIRQVDALDLSPSLRARLHALPYRPAAKVASHRRLGAIAAALILLAGLGIAAPTLYGHLRVGGELDPPPISSQAPAISDEELTALLAAQFPEPGANDSWALYSYSTAPGYSMGVLNYQTTDPDGYERGAFILGAFDNATKQPSGQIHLFGGAPFESREISFFPDGEVEPGNEYFLCIRYTTGATPSSIFYNASLYHFDGREAKEVTSSPNAALPDGMEDMFDRAKNDAFWQTHKIIIAPSGFEVFHRNPDWNRPDLPQQPLWVFDAYVLLADQGPSTTVMETVRRYFEDYYAGEFGGSSDYPIVSCESVLDYDKGLYGEDSSAYRVAVEVDATGQLERRYFLLDETGALLEVRDSLQRTSPWSSYADSLSQISIEGVPFGGLFGDLDESIRAALEDTGEIEDLGETHPEWVTPWMVKTYRSPSLEVCTATAPPDLLEQYLAEGRITRKQYDRVLGAEYVYQVRPLDGTYATEGGLRLGDSVDQAEKLFYTLPETGEKSFIAAPDYLYVTTENGVVTNIVSEASPRYMGDGIFY